MLLRAARHVSAAPAPRPSRAARHLSTAPALRRFLVERYEGWNDGSESLSSSECEPLTMTELLGHAEADGLERWEGLSLGYPDQPGSEYLRQQIARGYDTIDAGHINVVAPAEGIYLAMRALLAPGDHVIATTPNYQSLSEVAHAIGCDVSDWRPEGLEPDSAGATPQFEPRGLRELLEPGRTKLVVANWPHNPTGALPSASDLEEIVAACEASGAYLFVDEMYRGLEHGSTPPLAAACDACERRPRESNFTPLPTGASPTPPSGLRDTRMHASGAWQTRVALASPACRRRTACLGCASAGLPRATPPS